VIFCSLLPLIVLIIDTEFHVLGHSRSPAVSNTSIHPMIPILFIVVNTIGGKELEDREIMGPFYGEHSFVNWP
jgi:hypothetical protein